MGIFTETEAESRSWHLTYEGHGWQELSSCISCLANGRHPMTDSDKKWIRALYNQLRKYEKQKPKK